MKFLHSIALGLLVSLSLPAAAAPLKVGSTVKDVKLTDIEGNPVSLYQYLEEGYTVLVDISATWCGPCWSFENTGVGQALYDHYGPEGTIDPKKVMFLFIEGDLRTTANDLKGTGSNTQGDWVTGKTYPIVDLTNWNEGMKFLEPGTTTINFPTLMMICPDKKVLWTGEGFNPGNNEAFFVKQMGSCGATSVAENKGLLTSLQIYPNPTRDVLHVAIDVVQPTALVVTVSNLLGQTILQEQQQIQTVGQSLSIATKQLPAGIYLLSVKTPDGQCTTQRFVKE